MTDMNERNRLLDERQRQFYAADFDPKHRPEAMPQPEIRIATALEYIAFQLGQINRKLDKLIVNIESKT